ncbi:hypothetical protein [Ruminococcus albus]|uniref:hypothetical protein n=1 Tax=Ruminococcus albus TaxID=1264 RepID=UPI00046578D6|nr:hypothetical protein [Ruminococcus albus]
MYYITRSDYNKTVSGFKIKPLSLPPLSFAKELNENFAMYIGWALWIESYLPENPDPEELKVSEMIRGFLKRNLTVVEDDKSKDLVKKEW